MVFASKAYRWWAISTLLSSGIAVNASSSSSPSTCAANCSISLDQPVLVTWTSINVHTTVTYKVILEVDEEAHTTRTSTSIVALPSDWHRLYLPPTNRDGTVTQSLTARLGPGNTLSTILAYPTPYVAYSDGFSVQGIVPTTVDSKATCLKDTWIHWPTGAMDKLTQPRATIPSGGDKFGLYWSTTHIFHQTKSWPSGWLESVVAKEDAFSLCHLPIQVSPADAVVSVLILTETEVSTKKATAAAAGSSVVADPVAHKTTATTNPPDPATTAKYTDPPKAAPPRTQTLTIGTQTQPLSISYVTKAITQPTTAASAPGEPAAPATAYAPAVVIGTDTVTIGATATINGVEVVATTASDARPQILVQGDGVTSTIDVAAGGPQETGKGIGGYIAGGLNGAPTASTSGAQFTGLGPGILGRDLACWIVVCLAVIVSCR